MTYRVEAAPASFEEVRRNPWWIVAGSTVATTLGAGPVMVVGFGVFLKPVSAAFDWQRSTLSTALLLATTLNAFSTPLFGRLIDRFDLRKATLWGITAFCLCTASISLLTPSTALLFALFAAWGITSATHGQLPYATAISRTFSHHRGLALSIGLLGLGIGTAIVPRLATWFVDHLGWRNAYVALAAVTFVVAFSAVLLLVRPPQAIPRDRVAGAGIERTAAEQGAPQAPGTLTAAQLARSSWRFWAISTAVLLLALAVNGLIAHAVPLMTDRGISAGAAAGKMSVIGITTIVGRLISGYLIDRLHPPLVAAFFFCLPAFGAVALHSGSEPLLVPALATVGMALGAEADLAGVLVSRYLSLRRFGEVFGYVALAFSLGVGLGPWLMGLCFDLTGNYLAGLAVAGGCVLVAALLVGSLGRPPRLTN